MTFLSKLANASAARDSIVCIGLDPEPERIPAHLGTGPQAALRFLGRIIAATSDLACAYKPNLAFFEQYGSAGMDLLGLTLQAIPADLPVILDAKRGDVPNTSVAYAEALFGRWRADAATVAPYLGLDSIAPFCDRDPWTRPLDPAETTFWSLNRRQLTLASNATSTAFAVATQRAIITATAVAKLAEQDQYEYIERFEKASRRWFVGQYDRQFGDASVAIQDGVYVWDIVTPKDYTYGTDFYRGSGIKDFDVYMDAKFVDVSAPGTACSGFVFRKSSLGWDDGAYVFFICNDSHYEIYYYQNEKWDTILVSKYQDVIRSGDWNRIGIDARGDHFTFTINNEEIFEMSDARRKSGSVGIYIQVAEDNSAVLWFDNFGFQSR